MNKILSPEEIKETIKAIENDSFNTLRFDKEDVDRLLATLDQRTDERDKLQRNVTALTLTSVAIMDECDELKEENDKLLAQIENGYAIGDSIPIRFKKYPAKEVGMIIRAAIKCRGTVYSTTPPNRHHHILHRFTPPLRRDEVEEGFIDDKEGFVGRHEALCIVVACGQDLRFNKGSDVAMKDRFCDPQHGLFSEDLW